LPKNHPRKNNNKFNDLLRAPNCPFVLFVGTKKLVKRKLFEEFLEKS
jgi:hypothetical protein